jgi:NAD(P)-dependent dehydrogenase (short-subunit alcohol dehydrogenase family)
MENAMPNVLITGANRGLGLEFARQYLSAGWQVYAACRDPASASELRQLAEDGGGKLRILAIDVTDPVSVKAAAAELDGQAIDLLLNNSGIIGPHGQTIGNIDYDACVLVAEVRSGQSPLPTFSLRFNQSVGESKLAAVDQAGR